LPTCTTPRRPNSGIVNIVGQHATYHIEYNAPLTSDIEGLARPMSAWVAHLAGREVCRRRWLPPLSLRPKARRRRSLP